MSRIRAATTQAPTVVNQARRDRSTSISLGIAMTAPLQPELAAAYVHELSADVKAVVVLDGSGTRLAGPPALEAPAKRLAALLSSGVVRTEDGVVWVARTADKTLIAVAGPTAQLGPTALDAAAAIGSPDGLEPQENP